ncbi:hypothetical protein [Flammeovirga aprica]|uniref:Tetratricopeptide repeat protein n=1 Tax=Flammeovirga aprica JL-4 TaxID=694437 RepID=A0A7X9RZQ8_9BACT|nr:hypothetical protein [Flammeovirga aprica]NME71691.1 hypothetical protein [Flammeovirga aprica JL-4]
MKSLKQILVVALLTLFSVSSLFASTTDNEDNEIREIRETVENAATNDWAVYADAAEKCIQMQANLSEAYVWIEKSIEINENSKNLKIKGDYLALNGVNDMAVETYNQAILKAMAEGENIDALQRKVLRLSRR